MNKTTGPIEAWLQSMRILLAQWDMHRDEIRKARALPEEVLYQVVNKTTGERWEIPATSHRKAKNKLARELGISNHAAETSFSARRMP